MTIVYDLKVYDRNRRVRTLRGQEFHVAQASLCSEGKLYNAKEVKVLDIRRYNKHGSTLFQLQSENGAEFAFFMNGGGKFSFAVICDEPYTHAMPKHIMAAELNDMMVFHEIGGFVDSLKPCFGTSRTLFNALYRPTLAF